MEVTKVPACKNGCTNYCILCVDEELARLGEIEKAALNLVMQKGRHNTETAYIRLAALLKHNVI